MGTWRLFIIQLASTCSQFQTKQPHVAKKSSGPTIVHVRSENIDWGRHYSPLSHLERASSHPAPSIIPGDLNPSESLERDVVMFCLPPVSQDRDLCCDSPGWVSVCGVVVEGHQPALSCSPCCLFNLQMTECVRTATLPVSPALEKRKTSVQNVQEVRVCMLSGRQLHVFRGCGSISFCRADVYSFFLFQGGF